MWTDPETKRYLKRVQILKEEGLNENKAERLAEELLHRDRGGHDLRICLECRNYGKRSCAAGYAPLRFIMQRCDRFALRGAENS